MLVRGAMVTALLAALVGCSSNAGPSDGGADGGGLGGGFDAGGSDGGGSDGGGSDGGGSDGGGSDGGTADAGACLGSALLGGLNKTTVLVGVTTESDATAGAVAWDVLYKYLAGGIFDSAAPCSSCASGCTSAGVSCANTGPPCGWWGCFQDDTKPPGLYVTDFVSAAHGRNQVPMVTYYELLQASGAGEDALVANANKLSLMSRYLADFRFMLQKFGASTAFVQVEPDFWGFAQQVNNDPTKIPAAVASANPTDCGGQPNTIAGLGQCFISMARKYAPNVRVGLHGSSFGPGVDATGNSDPSVDIAGEGRKLGNFLLAVGAGGGDFVTVDASDRDAGYYLVVKGQNRGWDATNATLPSFHQAFTWAKSLAETVNKPILFWQVPLGNAAQNNTNNHWKDNRVDYFFAHTDELAAAHVAGIFFGAGEKVQTTAETDGNNLINKAKAYVARGGQRLCP